MRSISSLSPGSTVRLYLPSLDGARGLAILMVLLDHFSSRKIFPSPIFKGIGTTGVCLFFSLSAFLLSAPFCMKATEKLVRWDVWAVYFQRRFLRIFPLYALAVLAGCLLEPHFSWRSFAEQLAMRRAEGVFWTIPIEVRYYFVLPALVLAVLIPWRRSWWAGVLGAGLVLAVLQGVVFPVEKMWDLDGQLLRNFVTIFVLGSCVGWAHVFTVANPIRHPAVAWIMESVAIFCLAALVCMAPFFDGAFHNAFADLRDNSGFLAVFWAAFLFCHLHGRGLVKGMLEWRPLRYMGLISYSVYVWHRPVLIYLTWKPGIHWMQPVIAACTVVAVAAVSFFLIERPLSRLRAGYTRSL